MQKENFDVRENAKKIAAEYIEKGDATGWFDALYSEADGNYEHIPWADLEPNKFLKTWAQKSNLQGNGRKALVVGCGLGDDAKFLDDSGFDVTAFDISPTAIEWAKKLHAESDIKFYVADLFDAPSEWRKEFEFVLEVYTIQPLPLELRETVIDAIAGFVAEKGKLVVVTRGREDDEIPPELPWALSRQDLSRFEAKGLKQIHFEEMFGDEDEPVKRFVVEYKFSKHTTVKRKKEFVRICCVKKETKQTPDAFEEALKNSIQGTRHAIKFISKFVAALLKVRTSNLVKVANAVETEAEPDSVYRQMQRFLDNENKVSIDYLKLLGLKGKLKILLDRTEWKYGSMWVNILTLSVAYKNVAIPILWEVMDHKGNATAIAHIEIIKRFVAEFGRDKIERVFGDREFGSHELFAYLIGEKIDFHIRLKANYLADGKSFRLVWKNVAERVKLRGKVQVSVFGLQLYVSCVKYKKGGKTEYLIVASLERNKYAIEEYKVRWQIETMFGCLKSRGFGFEETHLTMAKKIGKLLMMLGLGLCLAMLMGELQVEKLKRRKQKLKKNKRYAKSLFRIGLDALQNVLFNKTIFKKHRQFELFIDLLSC